jgi:general nucleoside transport system permease protein
MNIAGFRLERRLDITVRRAALVRVVGALVALVIAAIALEVTGRSAATLGEEAVNSTFGERYGLEETAVIATPILLAALAVAIGFRMRLWNIGVEGQFYMGAWAATGVGLHYDGSSAVTIVLMALAGAAAGALWALGPAILRAFLGINEVITTLLLNFVAIQWVIWFSTDIWRDRQQGVLNSSTRVETELPMLGDSVTLNIGFLAPLILAVIVAFVFRYSRWGYEVDMTGGNARAAEFAGIHVRRRILSVMMISGAIAGLSGMIQLAGTTHRLASTLSNGYGLSGFIVAALAGASIIGLIGVGFFIAFLLHAGIALYSLGLTVDIVVALYGLVLITVGMAEVAARYRLSRGGGEPPGEPPGDAMSPPAQEAITGPEGPPQLADTLTEA